MVATALVLMADRMRSPVVTISTAIIINREIGVSALREWMASMNQRDAVAVGWWGKVRAPGKAKQSKAEKERKKEMID